MSQLTLPPVVRAAIEALRKRTSLLEIATRKLAKETAQTR